MSEYRRETEFLRRCILYDASAGRRELQAEIIRIERARRCVHRAAWLMAVLTALALAFISYPAIMLTNFPYSAPRFIVNLVCALGMGSLISLLIYLAMGMVYRRRLDQRRRECCQMVTRLLEDRLGPLSRPFDSVKKTASARATMAPRRSPSKPTIPR